MYGTLHGYYGGAYSAFAHLFVGFAIVSISATISVERFIQILAWLSVPFFILLILTHFQNPINGSRRWVLIMGISVQPSEFLKILVPCLVYEVRSRFGALFVIPFITVPFFLVAIQPDLGTSFFILGVSLFVAFNGNKIFWKMLLLLTFLMLSLVAYFPYLKLYQKHRILAWMNPEQSSLDNLYQSQNSARIFFGDQTFSYSECSTSLYAINTDFIWTLYSCLFGNLFISVVMATLIIFTFVIFYPIRKSLINPIYRLAAGILLAYSAACFFTLSMSMGIVPVIGFPTPLLSYGGSSFITSIIGLALTVKIINKHKNLTIKVRS
jgi:rod shape determining protein RodA